MTEQLVQQLAQMVKEVGGRAMFNGGCVRDEFLGLQSKDIDIEVYGVPVERLEILLSAFGRGVATVGKSFAVYKLGQDIDVSLPRREKKTGKGHKGFTVEADPYMSFEEACSRRDFTVNAILKDAITGEIVDPYNGVRDIEARLLSVVSTKSFQEDSLRVLRLAQFASRLGFNIGVETRALAVETDLSDLPKERVWMELEKMFLKSKDVSVGVQYLIDLKIAEKLFPSLTRVNRDALRLARHFMNDLSNPEKLVVYLSILFRDNYMGNLLEEFGVTSVDGYNVKETVENLVMTAPIPSDKDYILCRMAEKGVKMKLASRVFYACGYPSADDFADAIERLGITEKPVEPIFMGRHLIELGFTPSSDFGAILSDVYERQIKGELTTLEEAKAYVLASH